MIDALPQRGAIEDDDARRWLQRTWADSERRERMKIKEGEEGDILRATFETCMWHIRRASGVGGSEAATVMEVIGQGEGGDFSSPRNLVMEKLLKKSPMPGNMHMMRGIRAEDMIQSIYHEIHGTKSCDEELAKLRGHRWDRIPVMIGTPDDIVRTHDDRTLLVDYKAPSPDVFEKINEKIPFQYKAQLHHYMLIAASAGVKIDEMALAPFNYAAWDVPSLPVETDRDLMAGIAEASMTIWRDHVMTGVLPPDPEVVRLNDGQDDDLEAGLREITGRIVLTKSTIDALDRFITEDYGRLHALAGDRFELATGDLVVKDEMAKISIKRDWNEEKLVEIARAIDVDPEDYRTTPKKPKLDTEGCREILESIIEASGAGQENVDDEVAKLVESGVPIVRPLDLDALASAIEEAGGSPHEAAGTSHRLNISRKKSGPVAELVGELRNFGDEAAREFDTAIGDRIDEIFNDFDRGIANKRDQDTPEGIETF